VLSFLNLLQEKKILYIFIANAVVVGMLLTVNALLFRSFPSLFVPINILAAGLFVLPILVILYAKYRKLKKIEDNFPIFLRDFVESVRGGQTVPLAFKTISKNDYGPLTPYVQKIAAQLEWGIPVEKVLLKFARAVNSRLISRIISSVIESHKYGGNLTETLEALSNTAVEIDRLRAERSLYLQSHLITGYIIFFVFLAVILGLDRFLVPTLTGTTPLAGGTTQAQNVNLAAEYKEIFRNLILLQGLFAGISVGKMAEGAMVAGIKHSLFMMFIGGLVFTIFG
jgi:flagellar protein FlaJ